MEWQMATGKAGMSTSLDKRQMTHTEVKHIIHMEQENKSVQQE
jgi:hypothetical protein